MNLVMRTIFGAHLYGTATPTSDMDYKGVYMPSEREILLNRVPKSQSRKTKHGSNTKNTAEDTDEEIYSLHYFVELACQGQTVAIDMLHAPSEMLTNTSPTWEELRWHKEKFYTKNLQALVGYARRQAAKYGIKGSRLASARMVLEALTVMNPDSKLKDVWNQLPDGEHINRFSTPVANIYQVCGKQLQDTAKVGHYLPTLAKFVQEYGDRARQAESNEGIDWKAVSHAFRAGYQTRSILRDGGFDYPLAERNYILAVKTGQVSYLEAAPALEDLIDECEALSAQSTLPANVDREWWDNWLLGVIEEEIDNDSSKT